MIQITVFQCYQTQETFLKIFLLTPYYSEMKVINNLNYSDTEFNLTNIESNHHIIYNFYTF